MYLNYFFMSLVIMKALPSTVFACCTAFAPIVFILLCVYCQVDGFPRIEARTTKSFISKYVMAPKSIGLKISPPPYAHTDKQ